MSIFFLRRTLKQILGIAQETQKEVMKIMAAIDNLNAAVTAAVAQLAALSKEVADLKAEVAAAANNDAAVQAAADTLNAAVAANPT